MAGARQRPCLSNIPLEQAGEMISKPRRPAYRSFPRVAGSVLYSAPPDEATRLTCPRPKPMFPGPPGVGENIRGGV